MELIRCVKCRKILGILFREECGFGGPECRTCYKGDGLSEETRREIDESLEDAREGRLLTYEEVFGEKPPRRVK